jgi:hypothetical protein
MSDSTTPAAGKNRKQRIADALRANCGGARRNRPLTPARIARRRVSNRQTRAAVPNPGGNLSQILPFSEILCF